MSSRLVALADRASGQSFGLSNYGNLEAGFNYLAIGGADISALATGNTCQITNHYHKVTVATGNIDNITDTIGAVAGQEVMFELANTQTVRNQAGGTGNIRTRSGTDTLYAAGAVVRFLFDGSVWREQGPITPGTKLDYQQITSSTANVTSTTLAAAITGNAVVYDGSQVKLEFWCPAWVTQSASVYVGFTRDGTDIGGSLGPQAGTNRNMGFKLEFFDTPAAGSHTYAVAQKGDGANGSQVVAGAAGVGVNLPAWLRVTKA